MPRGKRELIRVIYDTDEKRRKKKDHHDGSGLLRSSSINN